MGDCGETGSSDSESWGCPQDGRIALRVAERVDHAGMVFAEHGFPAVDRVTVGDVVEADDLDAAVKN